MANATDIPVIDGTGAAQTVSTIDKTLPVLGAVTETAPATDTASSGLNGRLQRIAQRVTSLIALIPTALGQAAMAASLPVVIASNQSTISVAPANAGGATYTISGENYAGYALATDMLTICGSATKTVKIVAMSIRINTTAAALQNVKWIKRSTANTGGTATNPVLFPVNSTRAAAPADCVVSLYSVIPASLGTVVGTVAYASVVTALATAAPSGFLMTQVNPAASVISLVEPITLNGVNESLCINWGGAVLPAGFNAQWDITVVLV